MPKLTPSVIYATYKSAPVLTRTAVTGVVPVERVWVFGQFGG